MTSGDIPQLPASTGTSPAPGWDDEDEIDLRKYFIVLVAWWREIALLALIGAVLAAGAVLVMRFLAGNTYEAATDVVIARVVSEVSFDERFRTTSSELQGAATSSDSARRTALANLVSSGAIAEAVIAELGDRLPIEQRIPANLLEQVTGKIGTGADNRTQADLIRISASAADPDLAAAIADAWAKYYVEQVNAVFGQVPGDVVASVESELSRTQAEYQAAQRTLEQFIATNQVNRLDRLIAEKQGIIDKLQEGKQTSINNLVDEELSARQTLIATYIQALTQNQILAFNKEQEAKRTLLARYIDAEVENQLLAFDKERQARVGLFNQVVETQLNAANTVFTQEVEDRRNRLVQAYADRLRAQQLLASARTLQAQLVAGGDAAAKTTGLALLLLNAQMLPVPVAQSQPPLAAATVAEAAATPMPPLSTDELANANQTSTTNLPANLQVNLDSLAALANDAAGQRASLDALIGALTARVAELDRAIDAESAALFDGAGYAFLDPLNANNLLAALAISPTVGAGSGAAEDATLNSAIAARFADLYQAGGLNNLGDSLRDASEIAATAAALYPALFDLGALARLSDSASPENALMQAGVAQSQQLLQLQGLEALPGLSTATTALTAAIDQLETEIQTLTAQREAETARELQLTQARELAWNTFNTLSNKVVELNLARTAANSEVRLGAPAVAPVNPVRGQSLVMAAALGGVVGLLSGVMLAFVANSLGKEPFLRRGGIAGEGVV